MSHTFQHGIRFALYGFLSLIITASRLISFPAGTKTFQSPAFPIVKTTVSKRQEVPFNNLGFKGYVRLAQA